MTASGSTLVRFYGVTIEAMASGVQPPPKSETRRGEWSTRTLFTYLVHQFSDRPLDQIRALLRAGGFDGEWVRCEFEPVVLGDEEFAGLVASLPQPLPPPEQGGVDFDHGFEGWRLRIPAVEPTVTLWDPTLWTGMREALMGAARRARYVGFHIGEWGDVYDTEALPDECAAMLAAGYYLHDVPGVAELSTRLGVPAPPYVSQYVAELGVRRPRWRRWIRTLRERRLETKVRRWHRTALTHAVARIGGTFRFVMRRESEPEQWRLGGAPPPPGA